MTLPVKGVDTHMKLDDDGNWDILTVDPGQNPDTVSLCVGTCDVCGEPVTHVKMRQMTPAERLAYKGSRYMIVSCHCDAHPYQP